RRGSAPGPLACGPVRGGRDPSQADRLVLGTHGPSGGTLDRVVRPIRRNGPPRRTRRELVVRPTVPVRRVDDASDVRTADRVRGNALRLADGLRVTDKGRLEYGSDPRLRLRGREWGRGAAKGPRGVVRGDDETTASVEIILHQRPCGRIERRVLLQSDLPDDRATRLEDRQRRQAEFRDAPQGPRPRVAAEGGRVRCLALGRE